MLLQVDQLIESFPALIALERILARMRQQMSRQEFLLQETHVAHMAFELFLTQMKSHVSLEFMFHVKTFAAEIARECAHFVLV